MYLSFLVINGEGRQNARLHSRLDTLDVDTTTLRWVFEFCSSPISINKQME
jgi:hypothetical protein